MAPDLSPGGLIDAARAATGLDDLGSPHFELFLDAWCADLATQPLSDVGRSFLARQATRNLEVRLRVLETWRRHPEIEDVPLPPIVRIMGFPRSGTTLLHNLMARHPRARALLRWELVSPVPPPEAATYRLDARVSKVQSAVDGLRGSELERLHWVEATDPEECTWGFLDVSGVMGRGTLAVMRNWADVVLDPSRSFHETYEEYRRLVQMLLWRNPVPEGGVLVLKCPTDVSQIGTFLEVFPDAGVVLCHRDPFRTLTSSLRVGEVVNGPFVADHDVFFGDGADDARALQGHVVSADAMVEIGARPTSRITSVRYADLMADPANAVVRAFEALSIAAEPAHTVRAIEQFLTAQRAGARAVPPSEYANYGFTAEHVRSNPSMRRYIDTFDVPVEEVRLTEPSR